VPSKPISTDYDFQGTNRITGLPPAIAPGQPLTLEVEIEISAAATLTAQRAHVAVLSNANYPITLPPVASNANKRIEIRIKGNLTKVATLTGNGAELIDGYHSRAMIPGESATLLCDGVQWTKIAGKSISMICSARSGTYPQLFTYVSGENIITINTPVVDLYSLLSASESGIRIRRAGFYIIQMSAGSEKPSTVAGFWEIYAFINQQYVGGSNVLTAALTGGFEIVGGGKDNFLYLNTNDLVQFQVYSDLGGKSRPYADYEPALIVSEQNPW
jgi:hypothetical protein